MSAKGRKRAESPATEVAAPTAEVRLGRWEDVLADVRPHTVIVDAPFSAKTHEWGESGDRFVSDGIERATIDFPHWTADDVRAFVQSWAPRTSRWMVSITDDILAPAWKSAFEEAGLYAFATVGIVIAGMGVRRAADGPASWTLHCMVARQRGRFDENSHAVWRALPGGYFGPSGPEQAGGRGKPTWLLDALVRDYSDPGMLIVDPCAGWGSTLVSARNAGRSAIGAEMDPAAFARCQHALSGDMTAYRRSKPARAREADPDRPGLFDTLGATP